MVLLSKTTLSSIIERDAVKGIIINSEISKSIISISSKLKTFEENSKGAAACTATTEEKTTPNEKNFQNLEITGNSKAHMLY